MEIKIYSTSTCSTCHVLANWLDKQGIKYTKKITDEDPEAMVEFMSVNDGFLGVPFTIVKDKDGNETKIEGFEPAKFKLALGIN